MPRRRCSLPSLDPLQTIVEGYRRGKFLMADESGNLGWYTSREHAVFPLDTPMRFPRSLGRVLRSGRFEFRIDGAFDACVAGCASRPETWISRELAGVYHALYEAGVAHTFEAWHGNSLAGGVLGLTLGAAFIGESMFFKEPNASKCALVALHTHLRACGFQLFDAQLMNPHLERFGAVACPRDDYVIELERAVGAEPLRPFAGLVTSLR